MRIDAKKNTEDIKVSNYVFDPEGLTAMDFLIQVEKGTSVVAVDAMLKGLAEFYLKPAGIPDNMAQEAKDLMEKNLKAWEERSKKKTSRLIIP